MGLRNFHFGVVEFVSYEKLTLPTTKVMEEEKGNNWGKAKEGGVEEWIVGEETTVSSLTPLSFSAFCFSDNYRIMEENGRIIRTGKDNGYETYVINKELMNVYNY